MLVKAAMMARDINAASNPYSIAVAAPASVTKRLTTDREAWE
jgi:hypothetical protein